MHFFEIMAAFEEFACKNSNAEVREAILKLIADNTPYCFGEANSENITEASIEWLRGKYV